MTTIVTTPRAISTRRPAPTTTETIGDTVVPWVYTDLVAEHDAVRETQCVLDLGAVGLIEVTGPEAANFVQSQVTRDVSYLFPERSISALILDEDARPIDNVIVHKIPGGF